MRGLAAHAVQDDKRGPRLTSRQDLGWPLILFGAAVLLCLVGSIILIETFGWEGLGVEFLAGLGGSLIAFVVALTWDRDREHRRRVDEREQAVKEAAAEAERLQRRLETDPTPPGARA